MGGKIYVGIGGWTFEPWRGVFYPEKLSQKRELEYASRAAHLDRDQRHLLFDLQARQLEEVARRDARRLRVRGEGLALLHQPPGAVGERASRSSGSVDQGLAALGDKLGPINWQFMATKKFDPEDFEGFLKLLPKEVEGLRAAARARGAQRDLPDRAVLRPRRASTVRHRLCAGRRTSPRSTSRRPTSPTPG